MENLSLKELEKWMQETREKAKQMEQAWEKQKAERIKELRTKKVEIQKELKALETSEDVENMDPIQITPRRSRIVTSTPKVRPSISAEYSKIVISTPKITPSTSAEFAAGITPRRSKKKTSSKPGWIQQERKRERWRFYKQRQKLREEGKDEEWTRIMENRKERERRRKQNLKLDSSETDTASDVEVINIQHKSTKHRTNKILFFY